METNDNKKSKTTRRITIIAICIILLIILLLLRSCGTGSTGTETFNPDIDPDAVNYDGNISYGQNADSTDSQSITIPGYPYIYINAGQTTANITLWNPDENPCYFTFEIWLAEPEELLYTSKQLAPGQAITTEEFNRALTAGQYEAVIKISTASLTDGGAMNGANMATTLIVQ